jgi:hypothetical protein
VASTPQVYQQHQNTPATSYFEYHNRSHTNTFESGAPVPTPSPHLWRSSPYNTTLTPFTPLVTPPNPSTTLPIQPLPNSQPSPLSILSDMQPPRPEYPRNFPKPRPHRRIGAGASLHYDEEPLRRSSRTGSLTEYNISQKRTQLNGILQDNRAHLIDIILFQYPYYTTNHLTHLSDFELIDSIDTRYLQSQWAIEEYWKTVASLKTLDEIEKRRKVAKEEERAGKGFKVAIERFEWADVMRAENAKRKIHDDESDESSPSDASTTPPTTPPSSFCNSPLPPSSPSSAICETSSSHTSSEASSSESSPTSLRRSKRLRSN